MGGWVVGGMRGGGTPIVGGVGGTLGWWEGNEGRCGLARSLLFGEYLYILI